MFAVGEILVSDDIATGLFCCHLGACRGACCVQGDSGAPLEESELQVLEDLVPRVRRYLGAEAQRIIDTDGCWEDRGGGKFATRCVESGECVFVTYEGDVAKCSIHRVHEKGKTDFPKPISCHLFPIRVEDYGTYRVMNYEWVPICEPARVAGRNSKTHLIHFLREPLTRKYGEEWVDKLLTACAERRDALDHP